MKRLLLSCFATALLALPNFAQEANGLRKAPELAFHLPGQGDALLSQLRGKVVCVSFILTTCPHCQEASREMTKLQQEYGSRGFQAVDLAINGLDEGRTPQQADTLVTMFSQTFQVGFPVGWIQRDQFMSFMGFSLAEYTVVPQLALIDRKGYIHYQTGARGGAHDAATLRPKIEELLAQGTGASAHSGSKTRTAVANRNP